MKVMSTKNKKRIPIEKIILGTIGVVGLIAIIAIAPGAGPALRLFGFGKRQYPSRYINNAITRLSKKGLIVFEEKKGKKFIRLTPDGKKRLSLYKQKTWGLPKNKKWDGKWRIVTFDIREERRLTRDKIRRTLKEVGFTKLQNSTWIYPYECEEFIKLLKADQKIGKDILYIVAERVEYDNGFKNIFNL